MIPCGTNGKFIFQYKVTFSDGSHDYCYLRGTDHFHDCMYEKKFGPQVLKDMTDLFKKHALEITQELLVTSGLTTQKIYSLTNWQ